MWATGGQQGGVGGGRNALFPLPPSSAGPPAPHLGEHLDPSAQAAMSYSHILGWRIKSRWPRAINLQVCGTAHGPGWRACPPARC